jgi:hypothetical protein
MPAGGSVALQSHGMQELWFIVGAGVGNMMSHLPWSDLDFAKRDIPAAHLVLVWWLCAAQ